MKKETAQQKQQKVIRRAREVYLATKQFDNLFKLVLALKREQKSKGIK